MSTTIDDDPGVISCTSCTDCNPDGVIRFCYIAANETEGLCNCSAWFGWEGNGCNEVGSFVYYIRFSVIFMIHWCVILLVPLAYDMGNYFRFVRPRFKQIDFSFWTAVYSAIGIGFTLAYACLRIQVGFDPSSFQLQNYSYGPKDTRLEVVNKNDQAAASVLTFIPVFYFLACLQISRSWIRISNSMSIFNRATFPKMEKYYGAFVYATQIIYTPITILLILLGYEFVVFPVVIAFGVVLALFLLYGRHKFMSAVAMPVSSANNNASSGNNLVDGNGKKSSFLGLRSPKQLVNQLRGRSDSAVSNIDPRRRRGSVITDVSLSNAALLVRWSSFVTISIMIVVIVPMVVHYLLASKWDQLIAPGGFNYILVLRDLVLFLTLMLFSTSWWYSHKVMWNLISRNRKFQDMLSARAARRKTSAIDLGSEGRLVGISTALQANMASRYSKPRRNTTNTNTMKTSSEDAASLTPSQSTPIPVSSDAADVFIDSAEIGEPPPPPTEDFEYVADDLDIPPPPTVQPLSNNSTANLDAKHTLSGHTLVRNKKKSNANKKPNTLREVYFKPDYNRWGKGQKTLSKHDSVFDDTIGTTDL